jgi:hypothetical protein
VTETGRITDALRLMHVDERWDAKRSRPHSEEEWAQAGVKLANVQGAEDAASVAYFFDVAARGFRADLSQWRAAIAGLEGKQEHQQKALLPHRDWLRAVLSDLLANRERARTTHATVVRKRVRLMQQFGLLDFCDGAITTSSRLVADNYDATVGFMAALFLDSSKRFGTRLGRCTLEGCEAFFLVREDRYRGNRNAFCSPKHTEEGKRRQAADRARKWRREQARKKK